jgi:hypothetical protein
MTGYINNASYRIKAPTTLTIASNAVTVIQETHIIEASTGTTDTLNTITPNFPNVTPDAITYWPRILIRAAAGHTITLAHGVDNLDLPGDADYDLTDDRWIPLLYDDTQDFWQIIVIGDVTP